MTTGGRITRALWIMGIVGCALLARHLLGGRQFAPDWAADALVIGIYLAAAALCLLRARTSPEGRGAAVAMGVAILAFAAGSTYMYATLHRGGQLPFPSPADGLWLMFYVCSAFALVMLMRARVPRIPGGVWADAVVGALALAAVGSAVLVAPILESTGGSLAAVAVTLAYPLADVLILGVVLAMFAVCGWRPGRTWTIFGVVFTALVVADTIYLYQVATGTYTPDRLVNLSWPVVAMALAYATRQPVDRSRVPYAGSWVPHVVPVGFVLLGLGITAYGLFHPLNGTAAVLALATLAAGLARAITGFVLAQKQTRELLARTTQILDSAGEGIYGLDLDGRVTFCNRATELLTGHVRHDLVGRHQADLAGLQVPGIEEMRRADGTAFPVEYAATPVIAHGVTTGTVVVFRDISERREVERMKDEFTSIVSHELRTPLTSIRGSLGLLASGILGPLELRAHQMVGIAVENTDRLVRLINDLLDVERMQSPHMVLEKVPCDAESLIRRAVATMQSMADEAEVRLAVEVEPGTALQADPDRLLQALTNLLSNAIKYSPPLGTVCVQAAHRGGEVIFSVRDEGRGIPQDKLDLVFERFVQVDASDSREHGGTGLGLAICAGIVEQHGGRIWAASAPGTGATISFALPGPAAPPAPLPVAPAPGTADEPGPLVLVCDDDPSVLEVVSAIIQAHGYRVNAAGSGQEALRLAAAERPSVILLDLLMPQMDGWETASALRRQTGTEDVPVVILSVLAQSKADPVVADVVDWLEKPLHERSLLDALDRAVRRGDQPSRVLVVEDDPDLAEVLRTGFERHGIETHHAGSGTEAIERAQLIEPDLIVLDLGLPGCDGFTVVEWLRRHETLRSTALLVYSARELNPEQRDRLRLGPRTEYLLKGRATPALVEQRVLYLLRSLTQDQGGGLRDG